MGFQKLALVTALSSTLVLTGCYQNNAAEKIVEDLPASNAGLDSDDTTTLPNTEPDTDTTPETDDEPVTDPETDSGDEDNMPSMAVLGDMNSKYILSDGEALLPVSWSKPGGVNASYWRVLINGEAEIPFSAITQTTGNQQSASYTLSITETGQYAVEVELCDDTLSLCSRSEPRSINVEEDPSLFVSTEGSALRSAHDEQLCLSANDSGARVESCDQSLQQSWLIEGNQIRSAADTRLCLTASSHANLAPLSLSSCENTSTQDWQHDQLAFKNGTWAIDLNRDTREVIVYSFHGNNNQLWLTDEDSLEDDNSSPETDNSTGAQLSGPRIAETQWGTFTVETIYGREDGRGVDLVVFGDGFTANEQEKFRSHVETYIDYHFSFHPLSLHPEAWNFHIVETISNESGADNAGQGERDTFYNSRFNCSNIGRLLCTDVGLATNIANEIFPQTDSILMFVNSEKYGGAGYGSGLGTASLASASMDLVIHELGHSFAGLADEYTYGNSAPPTQEPRGANASLNNNPATVKWAHWIGQGQGNGEIGIYEGAVYFGYGVYRPTNNSMMRTLGSPFYAVNSEQWALTTYEHAGALLGHVPNSDSIQTHDIGENMTFELLPSMGEAAQRVIWYVNGNEIDHDGFDFRYGENEFQNYEVQALIYDASGAIRKDEDGVSTDLITWQVRVN